MWLRDRGLRQLNLGIFLMFSTSAANGFSGGLINVAVFTRELSPQMLGLVIAAGGIGGIVSYIPASYIADIFGRKACVGLGSIIIIAAAVIQAAVPNIWVLLSSRVLAGIGVGTASIAAPLLVTEIAHPRMRQTVTALYSSTWYLGAISSGIVTISTLSIPNDWSWRLPCLLQLIYPVLQLFGLLCIPESPRWLVSAERKDEALEILIKYHANGVAGDSGVAHEFEKMCSLIPLEKTLNREGWKKFVSSRGYIHILAICILVGIMEEWAGNGIISYYLAPILGSIGVKNTMDQASLNLGLQTWNLLLSGVGSLASERYGRRILWLLSTSFMLVFLTVIATLTGLYTEKGISSAGVAVIPMLFLFFAAYDIAYAALFFAYPAEILPFELRAKGLAVTLLADSIGAFSNQYANPVAFSRMKWRYYCVFLGFLSFFLFSIYFFFPETKGRSLEEVSQIFHKRTYTEQDGESKKEPGIEESMKVVRCNVV
ncbi:hypothetical protein N7481_009345 [Penicillium waksmanii]|uniref:uncharacterized protein n=1 Tax=Penicillium waksmanii TaxID=69791 RepID=UPI00254786A0|nr:uncharacterized protein N7481_009345 [Penicillium waksmanii]KAJ5975638.1 hypothetical protein N7481_009345 [Penicillium waksmanii]